MFALQPEPFGKMRHSICLTMCLLLTALNQPMDGALCNQSELNAWLSKLNRVTLDEEGNVVGISLAGEFATDSDVERLSECPELLSLSLKSKQISTRSYEIIASLPKLDTLVIEDPNFNNESLSALADVNRLVTLRIFDADFRGVDDCNLKRMSTLRDLSVENCQIDDGLVDSLATLTSLQRLSLSNSAGVTDKSMYILESLEELRVLALRGTDINGSCFEYLPENSKLEVLTCMDTAIDDKSLDGLEGARELTFLGLADTKVTTQGVIEFKRKCPWVDEVSAFSERGSESDTRSSGVKR